MNDGTDHIIELSRMTREVLEAIQKKKAAEQKDEPYEGI